MNYFKLFLLLACLLVLFLVGGCKFTGIGDGRMDAYKDVRVAEEGTKQEYLKTKAVELGKEASRKTQQNPTLRVTSYDSTGHVTSIAEMDLQPTFAELGLGKGKHSDTYGVVLEKTPVPKGQIAESLEGGADFVTAAGTTPASVILSTGYAVKGALKEGSSGVEIAAGGDVQATITDTEEHTTALGEAAIATSKEPVLLEPSIEESATSEVATETAEVMK